MRYLAFVLPCLVLLSQGKIKKGVMCFLLQLTIVGWPVATIWALSSINRKERELRERKPDDKRQSTTEVEIGRSW